MEAHDDLGPGLHRLRAADPQEEAAALAARVGGVLCTTDDEVEAELTRRRATGEAMSPDRLASLELLARRLERATRIADRTRVRAETEVAEQLASAGAGMTVHPTTIRERAAAVETARRTLEEAEASVVAASVEEQPPEEPATPIALAADGPDDLAPGHRAHDSGPSAGTRRHRAMGVVIAAFGLTLVLLGLQVTTLWVALVPVLVASLWAIRYLRPQGADRQDRQDREVASSFLAQVGASTDQLFGSQPPARDEGHGRSLALVRRDRSVEELRVAERAWHELAGPDTDIDQLEEVVRRYDPQHEDSRLLAGEVVAVRAADVVRHGLEQQWLAAWREAGAEPPPISSASQAVQALRATAARAVVLVGGAVDRADAVAAAAAGATVIAVEPTPPGG